MRNVGRAFVIGLTLLSLCAVAQNNSELQQLFAADQSSRTPVVQGEGWAKLREEDANRRILVLSMLKNGQIRTPHDFYNAAMIFQHGETSEDIRLAHALATVSSVLQETSAAKWLQAASWDRLLITYERPQWYGTQLVKNGSGKWELYPVDATAINDDQRAAWAVPSLQESLRRVASMNEQEPSPKSQ